MLKLWEFFGNNRVNINLAGAAARCGRVNNSFYWRNNHTFLRFFFIKREQRNTIQHRQPSTPDINMKCDENLPIGDSHEGSLLPPTNDVNLSFHDVSIQSHQKTNNNKNNNADPSALGWIFVEINVILVILNYCYRYQVNSANLLRLHTKFIRESSKYLIYINAFTIYIKLSEL